MSPIRVCYVGGIDVEMRIPLLQRLQRQSCQVSAVGSRSSQPFDEQSIVYSSYELNRGISPLSDRRSIRQLTSLFHERRPQVVHAFDTKPAMLAMHSAWKAHVPARIRTITGMGYVFSSNSPLALCLRPIYRTLQRRAAKLASFTIFQNQDDQGYFLKHRMVCEERQEVVLGSGIDLQGVVDKCPRPEEIIALKKKLGIDSGVVLTMVSRLVKHKGVIEFLEAARDAKRNSETPLHFLLIGPLASEGKQAVSEKVVQSFGDVVQYLGSRQDVVPLLAASDVFVLPSYYREGVPRVLLEAGAMQLPLITTDMPGCREVVVHGKNGLLVPPKNVQALSRAMVDLAQSKPDRLRMGRESCKWIEERFDLELVASAYLAIYQRVLESTQPKARKAEYAQASV